MAKIPQSLQPTLMGGGGAITVADRKIIKQYGDLQAGRKYIAQRRQFEQKQKTQVQQITSQIEAAKNLPAQARAAKQAELRKILETIKEGTLYQNVNEIISSVNRYASQVQEQYNIQQRIKKQERQARKNQRALGIALQGPAQTVTMYETTPEIISYTGGESRVVQKPETTFLYTRTRSQRELERLRKEAGTQRQLTAKEIAAIEQMKSDVGKLETSPTAPVPTMTGPEVPMQITQDRFQPLQQGTTITTPEVPEELVGAKFVIDKNTGQAIRVIEKKPTFKPEIRYLGTKEYRTQIQPNLGTPIDYESQGIAGVKPGEQIVIASKEIAPDYSTTIKKRVSEFFPISGTVLTQLDEPVYVQSQSDLEKFKRILTDPKPFAAKDMRKFLREQQAKLKRDIGRYNEILEKQTLTGEITQEERIEAQTIRERVQQGQLGRLTDIVYKATEEAEARQEQAQLIGGGTISPRTARGLVKAGVNMYDVLTDVLVIQASFGLASPFIASTAAGATALKAVSTVSKFTRVPATASIGLFGGIKEYQSSGDLSDAIFAGAGASAGFLAGVYSKQIVEGAAKVGKKAFQITSNIVRMPTEIPSRLGVGVGAYQETTLTDSQIQQAIAYAKAKGITLEQAIRQLFGVSASQAKAAVLKELSIELSQSTEKEVAKYLRDNLKRILSSTKSPSQKKAEIKNLLKFIKEVRPGFFQTIQSTTDITSSNIASAALQEIQTAPVFSSALDATEDIAGTLITGLKRRKKEAAFTLASLSSSGVTTSEKQDTDSASKLLTGQDTETIQKSGFTQAISQGTTTDTSQDTAQDTQTAQDLRITPELGGGLILDYSTPRPEKGGDPGDGVPPPIIRFRFPGERSSQAMVTAYKGEVLTRGKYKQVTKTPKTRGGAYDAVARVIDNTVSAQGRVVPMKKKVTAKGKVIDTIVKMARGNLDEGDGYLRRNRQKFRDFKIAKGRRVPTKNKLIEKRGYRSDTPGEKSGLTIAQFGARQSKRAAGLPTRKSSRSKRRTPFGF